MTIEEVRSAFLGLYEKRLKLHLLRAELLTLKENARSACITNDTETTYSLVTFEMQVIETIIADTYSITAHDAQFLQALSEIRQLARMTNNKIHMLFSVAFLPLSNKRAIVREHNEFMGPHCQRIISLCDIAFARLASMLSE